MITAIKNKEATKIIISGVGEYNIIVHANSVTVINVIKQKAESVNISQE